MTMELNQITAFVTINRTGSFTRAAERLHLSQPAISRRIELLERELGAPLFERLSTGIRLSDAGLAFLPFAQQVLATIADGRAAVHSLEEGEEGTLTLAVVGTLASTQLTSHLQSFRATHPRARLHLRTGRSDEVSSLVYQGDVQLGLRYFADPRTEICSILAFNELLVVACSTQSQFFTHEPTQAMDLLDVPWVTYPIHAGSSGEPFARTLDRQLLLNELDAAERIVIDSLTAQKRLIEADFGIGLLPKSSIEEELRLGTIRTLPIMSLTTSVPVMAIYRRRSYLSRASHELLEMLTHQDDQGE
jgi:DNA-binding transcriptional LysR family regulator